METKTVQGFFQPQQMTREAFIQRWVDHFKECYHLANTTAEFDQLVGMRLQIETLAGQAWDRIPS